VALLSGIAWDHVNVFPTFERYREQFKKFIELIEPGGCLVYSNSDPEVVALAENAGRVRKLGYGIPAHEIVDGVTFIRTGTRKVPIKVFGDHNLMNMEGARLVCAELGVDDHAFYDSMTSFSGAARRLELLSSRPGLHVFQDFAHSPSKLEATVSAVRKQFAGRRLTACMELHTFSSLNAQFLRSYKGTMNEADHAIVYFNPQTAKHKKLPPITAEQVREAFGRDELSVFTDADALQRHLDNGKYDNAVLLMMTSGTFDGLDLRALAARLTS
jgi:UDP-N-acetylmuramate: L-alanyl-gamma-D-glutamyl-meso-diaminopimelate ligase